MEVKGNRLFFEKLPQPYLDPLKSKWHDGQRRLLSWEMYIGAESVRTIRRERELYVGCVQQVYF